jgi:methanethiol S-methyltransferase
MTDQAPVYGLWGLAALNSIVFILFAFSFFKPRTSRDWRSFGAFSAFLVALFAEMYGFPLSIYLMSGWLQSRYPGVNWFSHDAGHLLEMMFGWRAHPHLGPFHLLSFVLIGGGFILIAAAWRVLYEAQRRGTLATSGPYDYVRHPQYVGFILVLAGFLLQWPTLCGWRSRRKLTPKRLSARLSIVMLPASRHFCRVGHGSRRQCREPPEALRQFGRCARRAFPVNQRRLWGVAALG